MIKIFGQTDKIFNSNGDIVLNAVKAKIRKEDNGAFYIDIEAGLEYSDYLVSGNIIVANTPQGEQAFRITNPQKTKTKIKLRAYHVSFDSENYLIVDSYVVDKTCKQALEHLSNATTPQNPFIFDSDISDIHSYRCVRKSLYEALQTVIERWGGHIVRDNFNISILKSIGKDNGVVVQYKKNLKDITCTESWDSVVTQLLPVGQDGITLPEKFLVSETQYEIPYTKTVSFNQSLDMEQFTDPVTDEVDEQAYLDALIEDLRKQATAYLKENCLPQINYTLNAHLDNVTDIGDVVEVKDERLGVDLMTNVIAYEFDCILERYAKIEFGNASQTLSGLVSNITSSVDSTINSSIEGLGFEVKETTQKINDTLTGSFVVFDGNSILVLDNLPKEDAENIIKIDKNGISVSDSGIDGTFNTVWSIDGIFNAGKITIDNFIADYINGGVYKIGNALNSYGLLSIYNGDNEQIGQIDNEGITLDGVNIRQALFYSVGDTDTIENVQASGMCTDNAEKIVFSVVLPKSMKDRTVSITDLKVNIRKSEGGYSLGYIAGGYDVLQDVNLSVLSTKATDNTLTIEIIKNTAFNASDNTPQAVTIESMSLSFN